MRSNHFNHKIFKYFILLCSLFWVSSQQFQNSVNVSGGEQYSLWFRSLFFSLMTKILVLQVSLYVFPQWVLNSNLLVWNFGFSISVCCSNSWMTWNGQISFFFFPPCILFTFCSYSWWEDQSDTSTVTSITWIYTVKKQTRKSPLLHTFAVPLSLVVTIAVVYMLIHIYVIVMSDKISVFL